MLAVLSDADREMTAHFDKLRGRPGGAIHRAMMAGLEDTDITDRYMYIDVSHMLSDRSNSYVNRGVYTCADIRIVFRGVP